MNRASYEAFDRADPLRAMRERFSIPDGLIYLDGNSLGVLPKHVEARVAEVIAIQWGQTLIKSWNEHGWFHLPQRIGDRIGRLIGALPASVVAGDTISVNLFKLLGAALKLRPKRRIILSDSGNFPSDLYVAQGLRDLLDDSYELKVVAPEDVAQALDEDVAVMMLTEADYRSGRLHDMGALTKRAHAVGALTIWDLAHSAGALPIDLTGTGADFAVGCTYKYLNGGPGAPAFLYVRPDLQDRIAPPLAGWWGHAAPFAFDAEFRAAPGIIRNQCGTQPILSMVALDAALDVWDDVDRKQVREKSMALCKAFIDLAEARCGGHGVRLAGPREMKERGSHVSLHCPEGYAVMQALIANNVIGDFRAPDMIRFGLTPLYTRFTDVWDAVDLLARILDRRLWDQPQFLGEEGGHMIIDISQPLAPGMAVFPGDAAYDERWTFRIRPGCPVNVSQVSFSAHCGTHADAPLHYDAAGAAVGALALDPFVGPCRVIDARGSSPLCEPEQVMPFLDDAPPRILLRLVDGFDPKSWPTGFRSLAPETVRLLASRNVKLAGIDTPSVDPETSKDLPSHMEARRAHMRILENLVLAHVEPGDYELIALPLAFANLDASPVRAILRS